MEQCLLFVQDGPRGLLLACDSGRKQRRAWGPGDRAPAVCVCTGCMHILHLELLSEILLKPWLVSHGVREGSFMNFPVVS